MKETLSPKERLFACLDRQSVDRIPVAQPLQTGTVELMKSCGAYWPQAHKDPELMAALAYEAYRVIGFESVRVPFDINTESEAMGCVLNFSAGPNKGLDIQPTVKTPPMTALDDYENVIDPDPYKDGRMPIVLKAIEILKKKLPDTVPIFSLVVGPFMVAAQVRGVDAFMRELIRQPESCVRLIERAHKACLNFARAQVEAGSDCVIIADATASADLISPTQFDKYAKPYTKDICEKLPVPSILHICGKAHPIITRMAEITSAISIDSSVDVAEAKELVGQETCVCGNVDVNTVLLFGKPPDVEEAVKACIDKGVDLLTTSCGIPSIVSTENLKAMVEAGKKYGRK